MESSAGHNELNYKHLIADAGAAVGQSEERLGTAVLSFQQDLGLWRVLGNTIEFLLVIGILLVILFLGIGGVQFITATGNKEKQKTATETIKYAIFGFVLILGFGVIISIITSLIGTI